MRCPNSSLLEGVPFLRPAFETRAHGPAQAEAAVAAISERLRGAGAVTIAVNDPQRATDSPAVLAGLRDVLAAARCRAVVATGTHRFAAGRRQAFEQRLASALPLAEIAWHDCRSQGLVALAGELPWRCHPWLADGDGPVLAVGSCEPHYFAGITGAHKTVTIGCAAFEDVQANHAAALSSDSRPGRLGGNPVHEGIAAMVRTLQARRELLAVNLLQLGDRLVAAVSGDPLEALERIAPTVRSACFAALPSPADALVLEVTGVLGRSFYQADKGIKNSEWAVRNGGTLVLLAPCPDGVGQRDFLELLRRCPDHASAIAEVRRRSYRLGDHKAVKLRYLTDRRGVRVFLVSAGLSPPVAKLLGFRKAESAGAALSAAGIDPGRHAVFRVADAANTCVTVGAAGRAL